jgi:hypothetical protein
VIEESLILCQGGDVTDKNYFVDRDGSFPEGELAWWLNNWTGDEPPANVWLGTSVEDQQRADERIPELLKCPAKIRFLSAEPLLGPIDLKRINMPITDTLDVLRGERFDGGTGCICEGTESIDWVIAGGESGPNSRPCNVAWIRSIVEQCKAAGVKVFCKQLGGHVADNDTTSAAHFEEEQCWPKGTKTDFHRVLLKDKKGGTPEEWPADLRVRQMPATPAGVSK